MAWGGCSQQKRWQPWLHIPPELPPASKTTRLTSQSVVAGFVLLYLFGMSLINVANSVDV